jgi:hypothetical protein
MVNARFGGHAISSAAQVVAPALMVMAVILFMGAVSGAHLNPAVSIAFALRGDSARRRRRDRRHPGGPGYPGHLVDTRPDWVAVGGPARAPGGGAQ